MNAPTSASPDVNNIDRSVYDPGDRLKGVHPDLVKVIETAWVLGGLEHPFTVVYGVRTLAAEALDVRTGHSTTMHSRHLPNHEGLGCAVDLAALVDGQPNFAPGHEEAVFAPIAGVIEEAARKLGIPVEWGGDWVTFKDWGHFQLPWSRNP